MQLTIVEGCCPAGEKAEKQYEHVDVHHVWRHHEVKSLMVGFRCTGYTSHLLCACAYVATWVQYLAVSCHCSGLQMIETRPQPYSPGHAVVICAVKLTERTCGLQIMATVLIGSTTMELEKAFRMMMIELARKLSTKECDGIAYIANVMDIVRMQPEAEKQDYRVTLVSTLESHGHIAPLKLDFLEETLTTSLKRHDLLDVVAKYKEKQCYKDAMKKQEKLLKKRKANKQKKHASAQRSSGSCELLAVKTASECSRLHQFQETFQVFLTQFAQMTISMRSALDTGDLTKMKHAFENVVDNGDAVIQTLQKKLSAAGINRLSCSSGESSQSGGKDTRIKCTIIQASPDILKSVFPSNANPQPNDG